MQLRSFARLAIAALASVALAAAAAPPAKPAPDHQPKGSATVEPSNPAIRLLKGWLAAMKTSDAAFFRFRQEHMSGTPGDPQQWIAQRHQLRDLQLYSVGSTTADGTDVWLFDPNIDMYVKGTVKLRANNPDKIASIALQPTPERPAGVAPTPKLEGAALVKAFRGRAEHYVASGDFAGAVLLAKNGHVLFEKAYGLADIKAHKPNRLDTQFRFGSMGKMFTMVAIMQLVQAGKVELSAPVGRYLTDYPNHDIATKVTVSNLLSHTGGTGDIFGPEFDSHRLSLRDLKDYVDLYGKRAPAFAPGTRFDYSNYGFILLGRIVEKVSGQSYDDYIQRNIFAPAGMRSTGNLPETDPLPRRAVAYMGSGAKLKRADSTLPVRGTSAGGGYSTVGDFNRFAEALVSHRLLDADTLRTLITGGVKGADGKFYPYDFGETLPGAGRFIGHSGGAPGMSGTLLHFLDSGYTIVVLANRDPPVADYIGMFTANRLPAK